MGDIVYKDSVAKTEKIEKNVKSKKAKQFREVSGSNLSNEYYSKNKHILLISY